ncbi:hypothetical protein L1987_03694 [Smallanthus sonchifolius]|uniref:Uncharacterized protein n=1 Tax=Smallanthus sonchifolius TaxID=185202 RepID=A0ACB9KBH1_9ASTR|nr:hypothetical protein L1987_03694 [Smallanthus sonchifolius]
MESNNTRFALTVLLLSAVVMVASASADSGYGKSQLEGYMKPKPATPKEHTGYEKPDPKVPTKSVLPKEEHGAYEKTIPKIPTKPVIPKEEHGAYEKPKSKLPTKPVIPKVEHGAYEKGYPKLPTKPVIPKEEHEAYEKTGPKLPTKPVIPKQDPKSYEKSYPKMPTTQKPLVPKVPEHRKNIAVQGLIYCKYGSKLLPLQGATARVTCLAVHKNGYESAPFSFSSCPANEKGYFLAKIPSSTLVKDDLWEITECKAFLENSPWTSCKVPEDTNGGIKGARLTFSRHLNSNGYCLSSVGCYCVTVTTSPYCHQWHGSGCHVSVVIELVVGLRLMALSRKFLLSIVPTAGIMNLNDRLKVYVDDQTAVKEDNPPTQLMKKEGKHTEDELVKKHEIPLVQSIEDSEKDVTLTNEVIECMQEEPTPEAKRSVTRRLKKIWRKITRFYAKIG